VAAGGGGAAADASWPDSGAGIELAAGVVTGR
jgi:hypothetical protein